MSWARASATRPCSRRRPRQRKRAESAVERSRGASERSSVQNPMGKLAEALVFQRIGRERGGSAGGVQGGTWGDGRTHRNAVWPTAERLRCAPPSARCQRGEGPRQVPRLGPVAEGLGFWSLGASKTSRKQAVSTPRTDANCQSRVAGGEGAVPRRRSRSNSSEEFVGDPTARG